MTITSPTTCPSAWLFNRAPEAIASLLNYVVAAYYQRTREYGIDLLIDSGWLGLRARYCE